MRKSAPRRSLTKSTLLSAACVSAACVSAPTPRPVIPTECPPGSEEAMRQLGITDDDILQVVLMPFDYVSKTKKLTAQEGPWTAYTLLTFKDISSESELKGVLYIENNRLQGRFTRIRPLGMDKDFPICMQMMFGGRFGQALKTEGHSKPFVDTTCQFVPMSHFK